MSVPLISDLSDDPLPGIFLQIIGGVDISFFPYLLLVLTLLLFSAVVSGSEIALFALSPSDKKQLENSNNNNHSVILALLSRPKRLLATILIANNLINIGIVVLSTFIFNEFLSSGLSEFVAFFVEVVIITLLILFFGEIIPKVYANREPLKVSERVARLINILMMLFLPVSRLLIYLTNLVEKLIKPEKNSISVDDLSHALELTTESIENKEDKKILEGIVNFGNTDVSEIMKARVQVSAIDLETTYDELLQVVLEKGYSRIPVYRETFDKVEGVLYVKDLIPHVNVKNFKWQTLIRPPFFVPENKKIDNLLKDFQEKRIHMAVVVDEYGGTSGIVTLEDVIEEIVGEITDEFDEEEVIYSKIDDHNYIFEGKILLKDLYKILDISGEFFDAEKGEAETLAGFLLEKMGRIPLKNEKLQFKHYKFVVESSDKRKIKQVKLTIETPKEEVEV